MSSNDTLSHVLRSIRLRGAVFFYISCGEEWAAEAPPGAELRASVMPGLDHVMEYHVMAKGRGWAGIPGGQPVRLDTGDIVIFPHGDAHIMSSAPGMRAVKQEPEWVYAHRGDPKPIPVNYHGAGRVSMEAPLPDAPTNLVCGFLGCDLRPFNPLIASLPHLLHLPAAQENAWIAQLLQQAVSASQHRQPGSEAVLERMSEMMFVDAVRRHLERLPEEATGWLGGLRDRYVGKALGLLHAQPARDWSVELLAKEVALSRSALYDRFVQYLGQPPMQYLANWRMQVAANLLRQGDMPIASIALETGYESEAAFARAFKRHIGRPPATWRREMAARG
jgi:AraC-like DNA-binding protein